MIDSNSRPQVMDKFEKTFEDLDVHTSVMEGAMGAATTTSTPANQAGLELSFTVSQHDGMTPCPLPDSMPLSGG